MGFTSTNNDPDVPLGTATVANWETTRKDAGRPRLQLHSPQDRQTEHSWISSSLPNATPERDSFLAAANLMQLQK